MSFHIIEIYNSRMSKLFDETKLGQNRSHKGKLVAELTREIIREVWKKTGRDESRLEFNSDC